MSGGVITPCCLTLFHHLNALCREHGAACPDIVITEHADGSIVLPIHDGGSSGVQIRYCPFCGADLYHLGHAGSDGGDGGSVEEEKVWIRGVGPDGEPLLNIVPWAYMIQYGDTRERPGETRRRLWLRFDGAGRWMVTLEFQALPERYLTADGQWIDRAVRYPHHQARALAIAQLKRWHDDPAS